MSEDLNRYILRELVGAGAFSEVFKSEDRVTGEELAIKRIRISLECAGLPHTLLRELSILRDLDHPNIIKILDSVITPRFAFCVFKFYPSDLRGLLNCRGRLDESSMKEIGRQILKAVAYFHSCRVIHRDLKPENILLNTSGEVVIADFGISRCMSPHQPYTNEVQTLWYRAPEIFTKSEKYSEKVDIWSVACVFAELLTGRPLFDGRTEYEQYAKINSLVQQDFARSRTYLKHSSDLVCDLVQSMLIKEPSSRITAAQALEHPFFIGQELS